MVKDNQTILNIDTHKIIATLPIMPYQAIVCLGAEEGLFPILFGKYVFDGEVIAFDKNKSNIDKTKKMLKKINLGNVELKEFTKELKISPESIDGAFISSWNLYSVSLELLTKALRKNSWLTILIDSNDKSQSIPESKISKLGFKKDSEIFVDEQHKLYNFRF
tara:strand:- start:1635 stop:2123 length:489 start_codon:yes stop_codon:yes gene_type:complete